MQVKLQGYLIELKSFSEVPVNYFLQIDGVLVWEDFRCLVKYMC